MVLGIIDTVADARYSHDFSTVFEWFIDIKGTCGYAFQTFSRRHWENTPRVFQLAGMVVLSVVES